MASDGSCRRPPRAPANALIAALLVCPAVPARAADPPIAIGATTLDAALTALGRQTGADIISTEPGLAGVRVAPLVGRLPVRAALARLLRGSGYRAVPVDARSFRIVLDRRPPPPRPAPVHVAERVPADDIVVTGSKQRVRLLRFPGSITVIAGDDEQRPSSAAHDLAEIARLTPILQSTELGVGRNKVFIRGVADSSFNGATQSTASTYFGDIQLGYAGADPGLKLHDMQTVEVMEGPQGTLYGAGAIGGVIRLTPNPVDLTAAGGSAAGGLLLTAGGAPGFDLSAHVNLPVRTGRLGVRAVGYRERAGGYIDDPRRGLSDVNGVTTTGGRLTVRADPGDGWDLEAGGVFQRITAPDSQYAEGRVGTLARRSTLDQPFHNVLGVGRGVVSKEWPSGLRLVSATAVVDTHSADSYDATLPAMPAALVYRVEASKLLLTQETRLARTLADGNSWVTGFTLLHNRDAQVRLYGQAQAPGEIIGVTNVTNSASLFAETTRALLSDFAVTLGGRFTVARTDGEPSSRPRSGQFVQGRSTRRFDPTLAASWLVAPRLALFGRAQSGYRTGGLAVARGVGRVADFRSDSIRVGEIGVRRLRGGPTGVAFTGSVSLARWTDIQVDIVNRAGQPYTTNIGDATIRTVEGTIDLVPLPGLHAATAFLATENRVSGEIADLSRPDHRRLPDTPPFAATSSLGYEWRAGPALALRVGGSASYVGRSVLGTGDLLDIDQGGYAEFGLSGGASWRGLDLSLTLDNLGNSRANRFAYGNPFTLAARDQRTPLRPFTIRFGVATSW